ncbi:hypothetical protein MRB53_013054 [Persea americana]|uniref:Uncharacterized protein n=1 Tax=Persea americana TaxID=3435 RepID=A0ACC2K6X4_PERAE|nr:hypothetical protein MRB53_013054 [Persea americana]
MVKSILQAISDHTAQLSSQPPSSMVLSFACLLSFIKIAVRGGRAELDGLKGAAAHDVDTIYLAVAVAVVRVSVRCIGSRGQLPILILFLMEDRKSSDLG